MALHFPGRTNATFEGRRDSSLVTRPRQVLPNQFYLITRSCTQRQFLLRPDEEVTNAFAYCLAIASERCNVTVILSMVESNHHHTVIFDREGHVPRFLEHLHKLTARCINALRGRWENLWVAEEPCVTRLLDIPTVMAKLVYAAANPVKDYLVERATQWPGLNGYRHLLSRKSLQVDRPRHFFREDGTMPATINLHFVIPSELGDADEMIEELKARVEELERDVFQQRTISGRQILGRRNILRQSWRASPNSEAPHRNLRPRFAGLRRTRGVALVAFKDFLSAYREALEQWRAGAACRFPAGTYWLSHYAPIPLES